MRRVATLLPALCCLLFLTSCLMVSVYPLAGPEDAIFDANLLGTYQNQENERVSLERMTSKTYGDKAYRLSIAKEGQQALSFEAVLTEIEGVRYLQLTAEAEGFATSDDAKLMEALFRVPTYLLARVILKEDELHLADIHYDYFKKLKSAEGAAGKLPGLEHLMREESMMVLTSSTSDLRAFVAKHQKNEGFFGEGDSYRRVKPAGGKGKPK